MSAGTQFDMADVFLSKHAGLHASKSNPFCCVELEHGLRLLMFRMFIFHHFSTKSGQLYFFLKY